MIENYDKAVADKEHIWHCHHRLETIMNCGSKELIAVGAYYDRPAHDLIFLPEVEHRRLHSNGNKYSLGKKHSDNTKRKMSEAKKGMKMSEEIRVKISRAMKGRPKSAEKKRKISEANKGNKNHLGKHHSAEARRKMSEARKRYLALKK